MLDRRKRRISVDQFFAEYGGAEQKYELVDGEAWMMTGGSIRHARTAGRILTALANKLNGSGCEPFNSDTGLQLNLTNLRYPDVVISCDPRDTAEDAADRLFLQYPKVIFEVLSPSTARFDRGGKIAEYKAVPSVMAIVHVDPVARTMELHERTGPAAWTQREVARDEDLTLRDPPVTLAPAEIFGGA